MSYLQMLERDGPSATLSNGFTLTNVGEMKRRLERPSLACNSVTIVFISWCESWIINMWCERDATHFVEMSVLYVACDAYHCDDTCQHFILVTGTFIPLAVKSLTLAEQANRSIFLLSTGTFLFIPSFSLMIYHLFDVHVVSGALFFYMWHYCWLWYHQSTLYQWPVTDVIAGGGCRKRRMCFPWALTSGVTPVWPAVSLDEIQNSEVDPPFCPLHKAPTAPPALSSDCLRVVRRLTAPLRCIWILKSRPCEQRGGLKEMEEITPVSGVSPSNLLCKCHGWEQLCFDDEAWHGYILKF